MASSEHWPLREGDTADWLKVTAVWSHRPDQDTLYKINNTGLTETERFRGKGSFTWSSFVSAKRPVNSFVGYDGFTSTPNLAPFQSYLAQTFSPIALNIYLAILLDLIGVGFEENGVEVLVSEEVDFCDTPKDMALMTVFPSPLKDTTSRLKTMSMSKYWSPLITSASVFGLSMVRPPTKWPKKLNPYSEEFFSEFKVKPNVSRIKPSSPFIPTRYRRRNPTCLECNFCRSNLRSMDTFRSHVLKDPEGRVVCPYLRSYRCPVCRNKGGDDAHTVSYCPLNRSTGKSRK